jgi:hypothetical protein
VPEAAYVNSRSVIVLNAATTALTSSVGTASTTSTIADVGTTFNQTTLNNNFRTLMDKYNDMRTALINAGIIA